MSMTPQSAVPWANGLPDGTIFNPGNRWHFMRVKPFSGTVRILKDGTVLAVSTSALRLIEVGNDFYDPSFYLPKTDVSADLIQNEQATHCPLKGDAIYYDLAGYETPPSAPGIAWSYPDPLDFAAEIAGRVAFYPNRVTIEEAAV